MRQLTPLLLACLTFLTACGFTPLHGAQHRSAVAADLASLSIVVEGTSLTPEARRAAPRRYGEILKAEIESETNPGGAHRKKRFLLTINYSEQEVALFVNPDGTASRGDLIYNSNYTVTRLSDGKSIASGAIRDTGSYSTSPTADYASYVSIEDARRRGIIALAQNYKLRLAALLPTLNNPDAQAVAPDSAKSPPVLQPVHSYETIRSGY